MDTMDISGSNMDTMDTSGSNMDTSGYKNFAMIVVDHKYIYIYMTLSDY